MNNTERRTPRTLRREPWDASDTVTVELEPLAHYIPGDRKFAVYLGDTLLGGIESYVGQTHRHLYAHVGTFGKRRRFWAATTPGGQPDYFRKHPSQAEAIRALLS